MASALGAHSPKLDAVRALRTKRGRAEQGRFAFEGPTLLAEAVRSRVRLEAIYATEAAYDALAADLRGALDAPVYLVPERALARLSELETSPGVLAVAAWRLEPAAALLGDGEPALLLAGVGDPGNAGTLLRSAEIFGIGTVLFGSGGVEPYNPKVVRASMGAIFRLRVASVTADALASLAEENRYSVVAADRSGEPLAAYTFAARSIIAIGGERSGVASWLKSWDSAIAIPQIGPGESLNAAVAGSIVLYEFARFRSTPG
jgi:RNA methyltransferase, TrmH family